MSLISLEFLIFFVIVAIIYFMLPGRIQWVWLFLAGLYFYFRISSLAQFIIFILITLINWFAALKMSEENSKRKTVYVVTLIADIAFLAIFKYCRFFYDIILAFLSLFNINSAGSYLDRIVTQCETVAPGRISYFILIIIAYITDVYWAKHEAQKNPGKALLFFSYFPLMTSGPIVTYEQMNLQLWGSKHKFSYDRVVRGIERIIWGVFKKIVISERCAVIVNRIYGNYETYTGFYVLVAAILFAMQLYCDFSGLMDIVLGVSECFEIYLPENFDTPFYSLNLSEFWRRWHITLGAFLRDYVLYPVQRSNAFRKMRSAFKKRFGKGYEKKCNIPLFVSLLISWFLIGLWHGGGWNYIFGVGLYMWAVIVIGELLKPVFSKMTQIMHINTECESFRLFQRIRTFVLFIFGLSFFRAVTLTDGFKMWKLGFSKFNPWIFVDESLFGLGLDRREWGILVFGLILVFIVSYIANTKSDVRTWLHNQNFVFRLIVFGALFAMIIVWGYYGMDFNAADFIYGRF